VVGHHGDTLEDLLGWWDIMGTPLRTPWGGGTSWGHHGNTPEDPLGWWDIMGTPWEHP